MPLKCSSLVILYKNLSLSDHSFRRWRWHFLNFILYFSIARKKVVFKAPKVVLDGHFDHWDVHLCLFYTKIQSFRRWAWQLLTFVGLFSLLRVLRESILFDEIFEKIWNVIFATILNHWKILIWILNWKQSTIHICIVLYF